MHKKERATFDADLKISTPETLQDREQDHLEINWHFSYTSPTPYGTKKIHKSWENEHLYPYPYIDDDCDDAQPTKAGLFESKLHRGRLKQIERIAMS